MLVGVGRRTRRASAWNWWVDQDQAKCGRRRARGRCTRVERRKRGPGREAGVPCASRAAARGAWLAGERERERVVGDCVCGVCRPWAESVPLSLCPTAAGGTVWLALGWTRRGGARAGAFRGGTVAVPRFANVRMVGTSATERTRSSSSSRLVRRTLLYCCDQTVQCREDTGCTLYTVQVLSPVPQCTHARTHARLTRDDPHNRMGGTRWLRALLPRQSYWSRKGNVIHTHTLTPFQKHPIECPASSGGNVCVQAGGGNAMRREGSRGWSTVVGGAGRGRARDAAATRCIRPVLCCGGVCPVADTNTTTTLLSRPSLTVVHYAIHTLYFAGSSSTF